MLTLHAIMLPYSLRLWGQESGLTDGPDEGAPSAARKLEKSEKSEEAPLSPWAVEAETLNARLAKAFGESFSAGTPELIPLWFSADSGLPLPQDGSADSIQGKLRWSIPMLRFRDEGLVDLLRGIAAEPPPGMAIGQSLMGWSDLQDLSVDLVSQGRIMPRYVVMNGRSVHTLWDAFPGKWDQFLADEVAQSLPEWSWMEFKRKGQDGIPDKATVMASALNLLIHLNMCRALSDGTFGRGTSQPEDRLRLKKLENKVLRSGSLTVLCKFIELYGDRMLADYMV